MEIKKLPCFLDEFMKVKEITVVRGGRSREMWKEPATVRPPLPPGGSNPAECRFRGLAEKKKDVNFDRSKPECA